MLNIMKGGLLLNKAFVSSYALSILLFVSSFGYLHLAIMKNVIQIHRNNIALSERVYMEAIILKKAKLIYESGDINSGFSVQYSNYDIDVVMEHNNILITFNTADNSISVKYEYDGEFNRTE